MDPGGAAVVRIGLFLLGLIFFLTLELVRPYRRPALSKTKRWLSNLALTGLNSGLAQLVLVGVMAGLYAHLAETRAGLFNALAMPLWARVLATVVVLDFVTYIWHLLNHVVPFLWRFHRVHHSDLEMDVSTATRFHLGEILISAVLRISLIYLLGAEPLGVLVFEAGMMLSTQFHHSSLRIPDRLDRAWLLLFVPPSIHRIHHSVVIKERDTNYGVIFSLWDRFMGTLKTDADQETLTIGMGSYRDPDRLGFFRLLLMPFTKRVR